MKIIIVGAGIAGLSLAIALGQLGHDVLILEAATQLAEIGAGIQMTPQAVKYFFQWGLKDDILAESIVPRRIYVRDHRDGSVIGEVPISELDRRYGAPYIVVHRAVLHNILHRHAVRAGAQVRLGSRVAQYHFDAGGIELQSGDRLDADLVVAADGINSFARSQLLQSLDPGARPTGWAAFRMMAEVSKIKADPETSSLADLDSYSSNFWVAPDVSCMIYLVKDATMLNIVLSHRDNVDTGDFTYEQYKKMVDELFQEFEHPVRRLLDISLPKIVNYPVYEVPPLPHWAHSSGRFTLVGDSAHAMAFHLSMGVSLAVEDAVSLATVLDLATKGGSKGSRNLKHALSLFENVRKRRAESVQEASLHSGNMVHIPWGPDRDALYESLRHAHQDDDSLPIGKDGGKRVIFGIADKRTRDWCYGYDAVADVTSAYYSEG